LLRSTSCFCGTATKRTSADHLKDLRERIGAGKPFRYDAQDRFRPGLITAHRDEAVEVGRDVAAEFVMRYIEASAPVSCLYDDSSTTSYSFELERSMPARISEKGIYHASDRRAGNGVALVPLLAVTVHAKTPDKWIAAAQPYPVPASPTGSLRKRAFAKTSCN
jgi:hypothetical protein